MILFLCKHTGKHGEVYMCMMGGVVVMMAGESNNNLNQPAIINLFESGRNILLGVFQDYRLN